ncbi:hypothetical protein CfE428DRAFT_3256 [Chthoniobacter flavus Ellin428]|uniref:Uncharacterized protein n=1 Tax=Chthoniobacter flavus Ellin428 TaxID=497964 RepID=B4D2W8_9BACT|nr:hypothetical protein [Chthoniobacter flavus]EDY19079.1 hypothetical protein CfE428DRAFT_3256 [Chthoniobacter flavus Ellin428]TCO86841.1 hypothetical protein EV701_12658 [Chthoniobacter flavus]
MKEAILNRPWLFILAGYLFAMSAWAVMVTIAIRHQDTAVPIAVPAKHP